ncbi:MAG: hypothetical protein E6I52_06365 [Chloroflexi bacterium]|nr:MAG: hypothetical protein E6I52_06365 [Chloroflexota bacterium]
MLAPGLLSGKNRAVGAVGSVRALDVLDTQHSQQVTVGVRHQHVPRARRGHVMGHVMHGDVGSVRDGGQLHDVLDTRLRIGVYRLAA